MDGPPQILTEAMVLAKSKVERLEDVTSVNLWGSDLCDVSILSRMPRAQVLSLSVNQVASLADFSHCRQLQELYLRKNAVADLTDVGYLSGLPDLRILWLVDNPCAKHPLYRALVIRMLPALVKLDNTDVGPAERADLEALRDPELLELEEKARGKLRALFAPPQPAVTDGHGDRGYRAGDGMPAFGSAGAGAGQGRPATSSPSDPVLAAVMMLVPTLDASGLEAVHRLSGSLLSSMRR